MARVLALSSSEHIRRSLIPVRWTIQSSLVSTIRSRSALLSTLSGTCIPIPWTTARMLIYFSLRSWLIASRIVGTSPFSTAVAAIWTALRIALALLRP